MFSESYLFNIVVALPGVLGGIAGVILIFGGGGLLMHRWFKKSGMQADIHKFAAERSAERRKSRRDRNSSDRDAKPSPN